jgi:hypothetical protein
MVRPERLFALRAHPFGVALRAIAIAAARRCRRTPLLSAGSSNHCVELPATTKGSRSRKAMVRPEGFEPPASWFVARRSIQLSYGRKEKRWSCLRSSEQACPEAASALQEEDFDRVRGANITTMIANDHCRVQGPSAERISTTNTRIQ